MTEERPPIAPGRSGLPADPVPVIRQPVRPRPGRGRALLAGGLIGLALVGTGGALVSTLASTPAAREAPSAQLSEITPPTQKATHAPSVRGDREARATSDAGAEHAEEHQEEE